MDVCLALRRIFLAHGWQFEEDRPLRETTWQILDSGTVSDLVLRVRIGVGRPPGTQDPARYVLARLPASQREDAEITVRWAADAVTDLVNDGLEAAQNIHHARA